MSGRAASVGSSDVLFGTARLALDPVGGTTTAATPVGVGIVGLLGGVGRG